MLDIDSLLVHNTTKSRGRIYLHSKSKTAILQVSSPVFGGNAMRKVLNFANMICNEHKIFRGQPVLLDFTSMSFDFQDKISYILLECVCYHLIKLGHPCFLNIHPTTHIATHGYNSSLLKLLTVYDTDHNEKFCVQFERDIYKRHFRTIFPADAIETDELSVLMDEVSYFLSVFPIDKESQDRLSEVVTELAGNAVEHTKSDCLIDIDVSDEYSKVNVEGKSYLGINIVILNLSEVLVGTSLREKICNMDISIFNERYQTVRQAYYNHQPFFTEAYQEEDFFNLAAFQHKISGRPTGNTGGTGLTKLIQSLEEDSDAYICYMISGSRQIIFIHEFLKYTDDDWIGFNKDNDFLNEPPDPSIIAKNPFDLPGTGYNLTFVMEVKSDE